MNTQNKAIIKKIIENCTRYKNQIAEVLNDYSARARSAQTESAKYKNEGEFYEAAQKHLAEQARNELRKASIQFSTEIKAAEKQLRTELDRHLAQPCSAEALNRLKTLKDFNLVPSRAEIEVLLRQINGNHIGLSVLQKVLTDNGSPFDLKFKTVLDFERDLKAVEYLINNSYGFSPIELHSEACSVFRGCLIEHHRADGTVYTTGEEWGSIPLTVRREMFADAVKKIENAADSWSADCSYTLADRAAKEAKEKELKAAEEEGREPEVEPEPVSGIKIADHGRPVVIPGPDQSIAEAAQKAYVR